MLPDEYSQDSSSPKTQTVRKTSVCFDCSSRYGQQVEIPAVGEFRSSCDDDISHYVHVISTSESIPGFDPLRSRVEAGADRSAEEDWFDPVENVFKSLPVVRDGRRVVCSVGHFEACSSGYIDCLPVRILADTGAILSLVDSAVLERLGRTLVSLQPYEGRLSLEVLVVDQLHIDAILGVDALGAFGAVIDVANRSMVLQRSGETLPLGVENIENPYLTKVLLTMRLPPRGQALVRADLVGEASEGSAMLVEVVLGLPPALGVARSLCTLENRQVIVEVCNASTEEYWIQKRTPIAMASVVPDSAFDYQCEVSDRTPVPRNASRDVGFRGLSSVAATLEDRSGEAPVTNPVKGSGASDSEVDVKADFSNSNLTDEQKELFQLELD
ncbi:LOW QUALITY PROTEIN: hypothetical protein PHMEG_00037919, partial [Phytophthora megakarya]